MLPRNCVLAGTLFLGSMVAGAQPANKKIDFADALPPSAPNSCVAPNDRERRLIESALTAIELSGDEGGWLDSGAQRYFAYGPYRRDGKQSLAVCLSSGELQRVANAFAARKGGLWKGRLVEYQLALAFRLPNRTKLIVEQVAASAFHAQPQISDVFPNRDIRPFARTVLASFGTESREFADVAYREMSRRSSMGTGAAQVAAAAGHPAALPQIAKMMGDILDRTPKYGAIPFDDRNRLYELAWAIYFGGEAGKKYSAPIHEAMKRKVESWAPPFGMVTLSPKRLCEVLRRIEGDNAARQYSYCSDDKVPFEQ